MIFRFTINSLFRRQTIFDFSNFYLPFFWRKKDFQKYTNLQTYPNSSSFDKSETYKFLKFCFDQTCSEQCIPRMNLNIDRLAFHIQGVFPFFPSIYSQLLIGCKSDDISDINIREDDISNIREEKTENFLKFYDFQVSQQRGRRRRRSR